MELTKLTEPQEVQALSKALVDFVKKNKLSVNIAGKDYLYVEAWQFIGSRAGTVPIVTKVEREQISEQGTEVKYRAEVKVVHLSEGKTVSRAVAVCSNKESKKKTFDEYAVASMAQTRAIGKAYRNFLGWIVKVAGYEPTPADEINKEQIEEDLAKLKQKVLKKFEETGVTDSGTMIDVIKKATGSPTIDTVDDAYLVLEALEAGNETRS